MTRRPNVSRFATVEDTTWPVYDGDIEWALRYGGEGLLTRSDKLYLASVLSAYGHLTDPKRTVHGVSDALTTPVGRLACIPGCIDCEHRQQLREALQALYDMLPRYSCKADAPDGCPVCVARALLKGPK